MGSRIYRPSASHQQVISPAQQGSRKAPLFCACLPSHRAWRLTSDGPERLRRAASGLATPASQPTHQIRQPHPPQPAACLRPVAAPACPSPSHPCQAAPASLPACLPATPSGDPSSRTPLPIQKGSRLPPSQPRPSPSPPPRPDQP